MRFPQQDTVIAAVMCIAPNAPGSQYSVLQTYKPLFIYKYIRAPIFGLLSVQMHSGSSTPHRSMPCCWPQQSFSSQVFARVSSVCLAFYLQSPITVFEASLISTLPLESHSHWDILSHCSLCLLKKAFYLLCSASSCLKVT